MKQDTKSLVSATMLFMIGVFFPIVSSAESPDDILVIVNKNLPVESLSIDALKQIFLKKKSVWPDGERIVCIHAQDRSDLRDKFRSTVLKMTGAQEKTYWENQKLRDQLAAPAEMPGISRAIFKLKNAIGYAYRKDLPKDVGVKVVHQIESPTSRAMSTGASPPLWSGKWRDSIVGFWVSKAWTTSLLSTRLAIYY